MNLIYYEYDGQYGRYTFKVWDDNGVDDSTIAWISTIDNDPPSQPTLAPTYVIQPLSCYNLKLEATYEDGNGDIQTATLNREMHVQLIAYIEHEQDPNDPLNISFSARIWPNAGNFTYRWIYNGQVISTAASFIHSFNSPGQKTVTLEIDCTSTIRNETLTTAVILNISGADCDDPFDVNVFKKDCHTYIIKHSVAQERKLILKDYRGNIILEKRMMPSDTQVEFNTPSDGVYIAYIENQVNPGEPVNEYPIFDMCDTDNCYYELLKNIQCDDNCDECAPAQLAENDHIRKVLNSISGLTYFINRYVRFDADTNRGLTSISDNRMNQIGRIDKMFELIKLLLVDCGFCQFEETDCSTC